MSIFLRALIFGLLPVALAHAKTSPPPGNEIETPKAAEEEPWFTGSLLSIAPDVVPIGYMDLETYFQVFDFLGEYNKHWHAQSMPRLLTISPLIFFQTGLSESIEFVGSAAIILQPEPRTVICGNRRPPYRIGLSTSH